jgi:hypothetical protein
MNKKIYFEANGTWEKLIYWGWQDIEFHRRLLTKYEYGGDLHDYGIKCFHLEHFSDTTQRYAPKKTNYEISSPNFNANDDVWGLSNEKIKIIYGISETNA